MTIIFMPGAQKSGSSSLAQYLAETGYFTVTPKETHFLAKESNASKFLEMYRDLDKRYLDASQSYLYVPSVVDKIGQHEHDKKFVFILRNPTDRCYSAYMHTKKRGAEKRSMQQVIKDYQNCQNTNLDTKSFLKTQVERGNIRVPHQFKELYDDYLWPFAYIDNSCYLQHISRYYDAFGKENCYIIFFEDLIQNPLYEVNKILDFLKLPKVESVAKIHGNKTLVTDNKLLLWLRFNSHLVPKCIQRIYSKLNLNRLFFAKPERLSAADRDLLNKIFLDSVKGLGRELDIDLVQKWGLDSI